MGVRLTAGSLCAKPCYAFLRILRQWFGLSDVILSQNRGMTKVNGVQVLPNRRPESLRAKEP